MLSSELICASNSRPRAWGGGPSSRKAVARSSWVSEEEERERERVAGLGGEGSKVWEIVVVAVTTEERRWDMSLMESGLRGW